MHEMSVAGFVLDAVLRQARGRRVTRVRLQVGHLRQVVPAALEFAWQLVTAGTLANEAPLEMEIVPVSGRCRLCGETTSQPAFPLRCGPCGSLDVAVERGEELLIEWIEVADVPASDAADGVLSQESETAPV
jgi:hydrogenase nickel incorporation protein HypA/HybF